MGSMGAMRERGFSRDRYMQESVESVKLIAEGIEGQVPYKGVLSGLLYQLVGGLRSSMGYLGAATIDDLKTKSRFMRITSAALDEGHPHDVVMTKQAPNYWGR
jgi:IMP dehydrogenase